MQHHRLAMVTFVTFSVIGTAVQAAQRRLPSQGPPSVPVNISLKVGTESYTSTGSGSCTYAPKASIYNVLSEMWTVRQEADGRSVQLTLWRPANGAGEMISLSISGKKNVLVSTVRGGEMSGSGTVKLEPADKGGTFTVTATSASGEAIRGTIQCTAFTPMSPEDS